MSILLKALKKSEAQRQLGQTPGIHTPVEVPAENTDSPAQWITLSMLALSALSIAWFVWNQYREPQLGQMAETVVVSPVPEQAGEPVPGPADAAAARTPVESFQAEKPGESERKAFSVNGSQVRQERRQKLNESFSSYEEIEKPSNKNDSSTTQLPDSNALEQAAEKLAESRRATRVKTSEEKQSAPMKPHKPEPISFWRVPQSVREELPEFRVSVLVYADAAEDRFLVVNGVRLVEKGELSDGCVLDEIRRDGAIFTYKKYRFLVKG